MLGSVSRYKRTQIELKKKFDTVGRLRLILVRKDSSKRLRSVGALTDNRISVSGAVNSTCLRQESLHVGVPLSICLML